MSNIDFDKLKSMNFALPEYDLRPMQSHIPQLNRQQEQTIRAIEQARAEKEAEELRRHNEIVAALKEAGEKGATIVVGDNAKDVQIQQNTTGSTQVIQKDEELDYEKVKNVLTEICEYFALPQFQSAFGGNSDNVKSIVKETLDAVEKKEDETLIKKSLRVLREIAIGAAGNLIASGVVALLGTLPIG